MSVSKKLSILGGILLLTGLLLALFSNNYTSNANILLANRVIINDISDKSPMTSKIKNQINISNKFFITGIVFTSIGIMLQISCIIAKKE